MCFPPYIKGWNFYSYCYGDKKNTLHIYSQNLYGENFEDIIKEFTGTVESLIIESSALTNISIPKTVKKLKISESCIYIKNKKITVDNILIDNLPDEIEVMNISSNCYIEKYPKNLRKLIIEPFRRNEVFNVNLNFPDNLLKLAIYIKIPQNKYHPDKNILVLPPKLTHLELIDYNNKIIYNESLKYLTVSHSKNFDFRNIPASVKNIGIDSNNPSIDGLNDNIEQIRIFAKEETNDISNLPISITKVYVDYYGYAEYPSLKEDPINIKLPFGCDYKSLY